MPVSPPFCPRLSRFTIMSTNYSAYHAHGHTNEHFLCTVSSSVVRNNTRRKRRVKLQSARHQSVAAKLVSAGTVRQGRRRACTQRLHRSPWTRPSALGTAAVAVLVLRCPRIDWRSVWIFPSPIRAKAAKLTSTFGSTAS